jgi:hypothetical protein
MRIDKDTQFSDSQAVTATAISENVIDVNHASNALKDLGLRGQPAYLYVLCTEAFATATSVTITLESDSTANLATSATVHFTTGAVLIAALTAGAQVVKIQLPETATYERYVGLRYTIGGSNATAGKFTSFIAGNIPGWKAYANSYDNYTGR